MFIFVRSIHSLSLQIIFAFLGTKISTGKWWKKEREEMLRWCVVCIFPACFLGPLKRFHRCPNIILHIINTVTFILWSWSISILFCFLKLLKKRKRKDRRKRQADFFLYSKLSFCFYFSLFFFKKTCHFFQSNRGASGKKMQGTINKLHHKLLDPATSYAYHLQTDNINMTRNNRVLTFRLP